MAQTSISEIKKFTCPTCNAGCGLLVKTKQNKVISVKPDKNHPLSKGYCCPKGIALGYITNDKDRVRNPLKRINNEFQKISWKQALNEIAEKLKEIRNKYTQNSIAYYMGTNSLHHYAHSIFVTGFMDAIGSINLYNAGSVDNNNKFVAQYFLYGNSIVMPIPDLPNTDLFIIFGSNPVVTNLSLAICANITRVMKGIRDRGGEIYIIDPRKNQTAKIFTKDEEHYIPIWPNTDIFMLLSMINIIFKEGLEDRDFLIKNTTGYQSLKKLVLPFTPELAEKVCKVKDIKIYDLTRKFVKIKRSVIYGRLGTCLSSFSTLNAWAIDVLNIIAGKLDRPGGAIFGKNITNIARIGGLLGMGKFDRRRSRVGNFPDVMGAFPLGTLAREILTEKDPVRALIISGGNPALSAPNSNEFINALKKLELCVVLDFYINETAFLAADYILPVETPFEHDNYKIFDLNYHLFPHIEYTKKIITPDKYGPKPEWKILLSLINLMGLTAFGNPVLNLLTKIGKNSPELIIKILLTIGQVLDHKFPYISSNAFTLKKIKRKGLILLGRNEYGVLKKYLFTKNKKINLVNSQIKELIQLCENEFYARIEKKHEFKLEDNEFLVIGGRSLKNMNSWMHNVPFLWRNKQEPKVWINLNDANCLNLKDNNLIKLENEFGSIKVPILITDDIMPKVLFYPHGWGHKNPKLSFANLHPGENINKLTNSHKLEQLSGMPLMNGYKVELIKI
ncbi:MAG: molybdopterin-containing oxidoreductase family protein [Candidatus Helarchaeota archaeon]